MNIFIRITLLVFVPCLLFANYQEDSWSKNKVKIDDTIYKKEFNYRKKTQENFKDISTRNTTEQSIDIQDKQINALLFTYNESPQALFLIDLPRYTVIGRKYLSDLVVDKGLPGLFCSKITVDMILGIFERDRITQDGVIVFYRPLNDKEKSKIFNSILSDRNIDIRYPYVQLLGVHKEEKTTPEEGWVVDKERAEFLGMGEIEIRAYTLKFFETLNKGGYFNKKRRVLYDPACSTGQFLSTIQKHFKNTYTIGQELSKEMVGFAKPLLNEVHWGNSINPKVKKESVDVIFFRFLNSEVVTTEESYNLFAKLAVTVKPGGYLIISGHTPVLLDDLWFLRQGFEILSRNGVTKDNKGVFQYYILKRDTIKSLENFNALLK